MFQLARIGSSAFQRNHRRKCSVFSISRFMYSFIGGSGMFLVEKFKLIFSIVVDDETINMRTSGLLFIVLSNQKVWQQHRPV